MTTQNLPLPRPKLTDEERAERKANRLTFAKLKEAGGHKFKIPNYRGYIRYYYQYESWAFHRHQLPISDVSKAYILEMAKQKRIHWMPFLDFYWHREKKSNINYMQDLCFVVLDIDKPYEEVVGSLSKWRWFNKHGASVAKSVGGRNTHIHVLVDMSQVRNEINFEASKEHYKTTTRYKTFNKLRLAIANSFEDDTGLPVDHSPLTTDHIAISPNEIIAVNNYWKNKAPVLVDKKLVNKVNKSVDDRASVLRANQFRPFALEFRKMIDDPEIVDEILHYLEEVDVDTGPREHYEESIEILKRNYFIIMNHLAQSDCSDFFFLKQKRVGISIGQATFNKKILGITTKRCQTYLRQIAMYIWSLTLETEYEYKKKTKIYKVEESDRKYFQNDFLEETWYRNSYGKSGLYSLPTVSQLADELGGGRTWDTLTEMVPRYLRFFGPEKAEVKLLEALDRSSARDKGQRAREIGRYIYVLMRDWGDRDILEKRCTSH